MPIGGKLAQNTMEKKETLEAVKSISTKGLSLVIIRALSFGKEIQILQMMSCSRVK